MGFWERMGRGIERSLQTAKGIGSKTAKTGLIAGAVVGGITALGFVSNSMSRKRRFNEKRDVPDPYEDMLKALPPVQPLAPMQEFGPADGRADDHWRNTVRPGMAAQRQGMPGQPVPDAAAGASDLAPPTATR